MRTANELLRAALEYAERGWSVFPVHSPAQPGCSCGRPDCNHIGKHPRTVNGLKDASRDIGTIRKWWSRWPDANIGIVTGPESGMFVLDVDGKQGEQSLIELAQRGFDRPDTYAVRTGGGGKHLYFAWPQGTNVRNSQSKIAPGLDIRGQAGYVVAPPSLHASGLRYQINDSAIPLAPCPKWLLSLIREPQGAQDGHNVPAAGTVERRAISEGHRMPILSSLIGKMIALEVPREGIEAAVFALNRTSCRPPHTEERIRETVADMTARYTAERSGPDILQVAIEAVPAENFENTRERFRALCVALQRLQGDEPVVLPVERIAEGFDCHHSLITRLRQQEVIAGRLKRERRAIAHRQAARFYVLSATDATGVSHYKEAVGHPSVAPHPQSHFLSSATVRRGLSATPLVRHPDEHPSLENGASESGYKLEGEL